jgi:hypothetical protein
MGQEMTIKFEPISVIRLACTKLTGMSIHPVETTGIQGAIEVFDKWFPVQFIICVLTVC